MLGEEDIKIIEMWLRNTLHYEMPFSERECLQISEDTFLVVEKNSVDGQIIGFKTRLIRGNESIPIYGYSEFSYKNDEHVVLEKTINFLKSL